MYKILANTLFLGKNLIYLPSCHSTNEQAAAFLSGNQVKDGDIVITDSQTKGKGQAGNHWESAPGLNLTFSIVIKPIKLKADRQFALSMLVAVALHDALNELGVEVRIKWPNDIYYQDLKVSGILINNNLQGDYVNSSVIGIGLNVNQLNFAYPGAVSLRSVTGRYFDLNTVLNVLVKKIDLYWLRYLSTGIDFLKRTYHNYLFGRGEMKEFGFFGTDIVKKGVIQGVDDYGRLVVQFESGELHRYGQRELIFLF